MEIITLIDREKYGATRRTNVQTSIDGNTYRTSIVEASGHISDNEALSAHFEYLTRRLKSKIEIRNEEYPESKD